MEPITLRLSPDLVSELDTEATEAGCSSRSEYIRYILQNRSQARAQLLGDVGSNTDEYSKKTELRSSLAAVEDELSNLKSRVAALEEEQSTEGTNRITAGSDDERPRPLASFGDDNLEGPIGSESADPFAYLKDWLRMNVPKSKDARKVMFEAAHILTGNGPTAAKELRPVLWDKFPDAYESADTLWTATVERLWEETPGFDRPERGVYEFDPENVVP